MTDDELRILAGLAKRIKEAKSPREIATADVIMALQAFPALVAQVALSDPERVQRMRASLVAPNLDNLSPTERSKIEAAQIDHEIARWNGGNRAPG